MKKILKSLLLSLVIFASDVKSQCTFNNTLISTVTPSCPGTTTIPCVNGGQYVAVNVVSGNSYTFSTCGGASWDTQITLYNATGTSSLGYSDDACGLQSSVNWTATYTGVANVLVDQYYCTSNASCATLTISCTAPSGGGCVGGSNNSCATADPFCTGTAYNYCNTTGVASSGAYGCLLSTPNPMWMYLNVATSGNIDIYIEQFSTSGSGIDVDFALYGPYASLAAACPINNSTPQVDCSFSIASTETANISGAVAGQWYMLLITNYSDQAGYIEFSQTGGTGATNCGILPIELLEFTGKYENNYNLIKWSTASEINNDFFTIERSTDGINWMKLRDVDGAGTTNNKNEYSMIDYSFNKTTNYYRLKQTDYDGQFEYSNIIVIDNTNTATFKPTKIVNLLGQDVDELTPGVKIYFYPDGSYVKKY